MKYKVGDEFTLNQTGNRIVITLRDPALYLIKDLVCGDSYYVSDLDLDRTARYIPPMLTEEEFEKNMDKAEEDRASRYNDGK